MSFTVVRGSPVDAQLYLNRVIDDLLENGVTRPGVVAREQVNLAEITLHCLKSNPNAVRVINGATDKSHTNEQILKRAVSLARAMRTVNKTEMTVIMMLRNHEHMTALYYAMLLAGVVPFIMEPSSTEYEIHHFLDLVAPRVVFCEPERRDEVINVVRQSPLSPDVVVADGTSLDKFVDGQSSDVDSFKLPNVTPESSAILLPTSGSTGLPKAAIMTHRGLIMQLCCPWLCFTQFPHPTRLGLLLSTGQWMTHTIVMTSFLVYEIPVLLTSMKATPEVVVELIDKYRPTWSFVGPTLATSIGSLATSKQMSCFEYICVGGSPFTPESMTQVKAKMSKNASLTNIYGLTETQGIVAAGDRTTSLATVGKVANFMKYKLVNDDGEEVLEPNKRGELYLKSDCIIKGYVKNKVAYTDSVTADGWLKTGDVFYRDEEDNLYFANRTKLGFKYLNHNIYPEELEIVIGSISGVQQNVVVGTNSGPATAIVMLPGCNVTRERIHQTVNSTLSDHKRLRGGIAFVPALPRTHNGKLSRTQCLELVQEMINKKECF